MQPPFPDWMLDMVDAAIREIGIDACPPIHRVPSLAYAHPLADGAVEILGWRHPSFFR
ncbi:MAG: hypothetical protein ACR2IJ_00035 [Fluviibacter sp.]